MRPNLPTDTMLSLSLSFFLHCWCRCCDRAFARVQVPKEAVSSSTAAPTRRHGHSAVGTFLKVCFQTASEAAAAAKTLCKLVCLRRGYGPALIEWFVTIVIVAARQQPSKMLACLLHGSLFPSSSSTNHRISLSVFFCRIDLSRWFCRNYCTACCTSSAFSFRQCCCAIVFVNPDHTLTAGHSSLFHCFVFFFFDGTGCADASITAAFCLFFLFLIIAICKLQITRREMHSACWRLSVKPPTPHTLSWQTLFFRLISSLALHSLHLYSLLSSWTPLFSTTFLWPPLAPTLVWTMPYRTRYQQQQQLIAINCCQKPGKKVILFTVFSFGDHHYHHHHHKKQQH